jgi:hypothetical protein
MPSTPEHRSIERLCLAAFALSLLAPLGGAFALPAVVLAWHAGRRSRAVSPHREMARPACAGLALAILSLLFYSLYSYMLSLNARQETLASRCRSHMSFLCKGLSRYAEEHDGRLPAHETWCDALYPKYVPNAGVFRCPQVVDDRRRAWFFWIGGLRALLGGPSLPRCSYGLNSRVSGMPVEEIEASTVVLFETDAGWNASGGPTDIAKARHMTFKHPDPGDGYSTVAFRDSHVETRRLKDMEGLRWEP